MKNGHQSSSSSPYFSPREWSRQRVKEIDAENAERARHLVPTVKLEWERLRDERAETAARIKALESALQKAERTIARQKVTIRSYRRQKGETLEGVVVSRIQRRTPKMPARLLEEVAEHFGSVSMRVLMRVLAELVKAGEIKRVPEGYVR